MNIIKTILAGVSLVLVSICHAQHVTIDISQSVNRNTKISRGAGYYSQHDYTKSETVSKAITISIESSKPIEIIGVVFYSSGGLIENDLFKLQIPKAYRKVFKTYTPPPASQDECYIAMQRYGWGNDYYRKSGNSKIMLGVYIWNTQTGKFLGKKYTSVKLEKIVENDKEYMAFLKDINNTISSKNKKGK